MDETIQASRNCTLCIVINPEAFGKFPIWEPHAAVPILYGGLLSVGVGFTLQVVAQKKAKPANAAIILSLETVFAVIAGVLVLGEMLPFKGWAGCALMLAGMLAAQLEMQI